jgi:hypothetical protein
MRTDFERYYLPIVLATAVFGGVGVGLASQTIWHLATAERTQPAPGNPIAPAASRHGTEATRS